MENKKIKVSKDGIVKEIEAHQELDYVKNGWVVFVENPYETSFNKK